MDEIEQRARELLAAEYRALDIEPQAARLMEQGHQPGGVHYAAVQAIIAALTPPEGYVLSAAVLATATRLRRLASAGSPLGRKAYIKAAEDIEMTVSAARPEVK